MTISEFKAWLQGYEGRFHFGRPSRKQWAEIRQRLATLEPEPASIVVVTPNSSQLVGDMRVVALDAQTYNVISGDGVKKHASSKP